MYYRSVVGGTDLWDAGYAGGTGGGGLTPASHEMITPRVINREQRRLQMTSGTNQRRL